MNAVISIAETCLLAIWQASFRRHELYSGFITELGNLDSDDRLRKATACGFAGSQREKHDRNNLEAEYRCTVSGTDKPVVAMKFL
jgi:hypothetical protein